MAKMGGLMRIDEAVARILGSIKPIRKTETVALAEARGRILAAAVTSPIDVPGYSNSAMDGIALAVRDLPEQGTRSLPIVTDVMAGHPLPAPVGPGECVRIMTGAKIPAGVDTVIPKESVQFEGNRAVVGAHWAHGENIRQAGEDLAKGAVALEGGRRLGPAEIGVLASLGFAEVAVTVPPRVAVFSTGDEIRSAGEPLAEGQIYDANRFTLMALVRAAGADLLDLGVIPDERPALLAALEKAGREADLVLTSGGVSVGEGDLIREVLEQFGQLEWWRLAIKPGRPMAFGRLPGGALFFGLPGNPVAVVVTFLHVVQPALMRLMGQTPRAPLRFDVPCMSHLQKRRGRLEFQRGRLHRQESGRLVVERAGPQGSGILTSVTRANCFIVLPEDDGPVEPEMSVAVEPFFGLMEGY